MKQGDYRTILDSRVRKGTLKRYDAPHEKDGVKWKGYVRVHPDTELRELVERYGYGENCYLRRLDLIPKGKP